MKQGRIITPANTTPVALRGVEIPFFLERAAKLFIPSACWTHSAIKVQRILFYSSHLMKAVLSSELNPHFS